MNLTRFRIDAAQVAAGLRLAGVRPTRASSFPDAPERADPLRALRGSGLLAADGRTLSAEADSMFRTAAEPARILSAVTNRAGTQGWTESVLLCRDARGPFVLESSKDGRFDLALVPTAMQALVIVDDMLCLSALASSRGAQIDLDLAGLGALLAGADLVQASALQARIQRTVGVAPPALTGPYLEQQLAAGLAANDTRWAVTAARSLVPVSLGLASGRMEAGLASLAALGLVAPGPGGYSLTQGLRVAEALGQLVQTAGLTLSTAAAEGRFPVAHVTVLRSASSIFLAAWTSVGPTDASLRLIETDSGGALRLARSLLEPKEAPPAPQAAPAPVVEVAPAPAPVVEPEPALPPIQPGWQGTHFIPEGGLTAWAEPDPSQPVASQLEAGLPVQVTEARGDWARIVCSNGWTGWVDGRPLRPIGR